MITSPDNDKLKLVRKLREHRGRERDGLFVTEGEDLLEAGIAAGAVPEFVLSEAGTPFAGGTSEGAGRYCDVERELLDSASALGSGSRVIAVWPLRWSEAPPSAPCVYLHGIGDPGNVGAIIRSADALGAGSVVLGAGSADPYGPKAVRASMGSIFSVALSRGSVGSTPEPRVALIAHGGDAPHPMPSVLTLCLGSERDGLPGEIEAGCDERWTIPLRTGGPESLNVAAATAIALERISSGAPESGGGNPNG